jgi:hypothetical protein
MVLTITQIKIKYNSLNLNRVIVGDDVIVSIGSYYFATVIDVKLDSRKNKMWAYLKSNDKMCPVRADISDCQRIQNTI